MTSNHEHLLSQNFHGSGFWAHISCVFCSGSHSRSVSQATVSSGGWEGKNVPFPALSGCYQNSFPYGFTIFSFKSMTLNLQLLEAAYGALPWKPHQRQFTVSACFFKANREEEQLYWGGDSCNMMTGVTFFHFFTFAIKWSLNMAEPAPHHCHTVWVRNKSQKPITLMKRGSDKSMNARKQTSLLVSVVFAIDLCQISVTRKPHCQ